MGPVVQPDRLPVGLLSAALRARTMLFRRGGVAKEVRAMEVVVVVVVALVALWLSGRNWEQRSPYPTIFGAHPDVRRRPDARTGGGGRTT